MKTLLIALALIFSSNTFAASIVLSQQEFIQEEIKDDWPSTAKNAVMAKNIEAYNVALNAALEEMKKECVMGSPYETSNAPIQNILDVTEAKSVLPNDLGNGPLFYVLNTKAICFLDK